MMTYEDCRQAIYTRLKTYWDGAHASVPIQWGNRLRVDLLQQTAPFIACEVEFQEGEQASIELVPVQRYYGAVCLAVFVREHEGEATANTYIQELSDLFKSALFSGVNTYSPGPLPGEVLNGWWKRPLRVPFYFNAIP